MYDAFTTLLFRAMENLGFYEAVVKGNIATLVAPGRKTWVLRWDGTTWVTQD